MIRISFSVPDYLEITGSPDDLNRIRQELLGLIREQREELFVKGETGFDPDPYDVALASLKLALRDGPVKVSVENDRMIVEGGGESLENFAACFDFMDKSQDVDHYHFEYEKGSSDIHPDSISLLVRLR